MNTVLTSCTLTWSDGQQLIGRVRANYPDEIALVEWSGPLDRLPGFYARMPVVTLIALFEKIASTSSGARMETNPGGFVARRR